MARPVQADADATRRRILEAARAAFSAEGIDGTSMREVAAAARVNIATVHHYFVSKDRLAEACIDAAYEELASLKDALVAGLQAERTFAENLEEAVRVAWRFAREHRAAHRMLLRIVVDAERTGSAGRAHRQARSTEFLAEGAQLLASLTGRTERESRLVMQTFSNLLVRWSLAPIDELVTVVAGPEPTDEITPAELERVVEEHLIDLSFRLLGLERPAFEARS